CLSAKIQMSQRLQSRSPRLLLPDLLCDQGRLATRARPLLQGDRDSCVDISRPTRARSRRLLQIFFPACTALSTKSWPRRESIGLPSLLARASPSRAFSSRESQPRRQSVSPAEATRRRCSHIIRL